MSKSGADVAFDLKIAIVSLLFAAAVPQSIVDANRVKGDLVSSLDEVVSFQDEHICEVASLDGASSLKFKEEADLSKILVFVQLCNESPRLSMNNNDLSTGNEVQLLPFFSFNHDVLINCVSVLLEYEAEVAEELYREF